MISPGVEFTYVLDNPNNKAIRVYGDVEIPVYQRVNGNQLVASSRSLRATHFRRGTGNKGEQFGCASTDR
jgi:hypothetical protein